MIEEIFQLIKSIYETGIMPSDFQVTKIVTIPKKPNTLKCEEHRTLSLISHASKIILKIIQNRIRTKVEESIGKDQYGFRREKGTREAILALRMIIDRRMDLSLETHIAFVDLEKAFDRVDWKMMMKTLKDIGLDFRDRRVIYELYRNQETIIEVGEEREKANIRQGVRQGCSLSPLIFNVYIEGAIKKIIQSSNQGVNFNGERIMFVRFADDIAALAESSYDLEKLLNIMNNTFQEFAMSINTKKTKVITTEKRPTTQKQIQLNGTVVERVNSFRYLGSLITADSRCTSDIKSRIAIAKTAFNQKKHIFKSRISKEVKKKLIKTYIWSIALYSCETWTMTQKDKEMIEAFEMWCWRRMERISWTEKVANEEVLQRVKEKRNISNIIENRRGKMIGHLIRHDSFIRNIIEGKIEGKRRRGRPRIEYIDQVKRKIDVVSYKEVKEKAWNRPQWKALHRQEPCS